MKTIYADFNDFHANGTLPLTCTGSIDSIKSLITPPKDGEEVWLTDGELWARAQVFRRNDGTFEARGELEYQNERPSAAD